MTLDEGELVVRLKDETDALDGLGAGSWDEPLSSLRPLLDLLPDVLRLCVRVGEDVEGRNVEVERLTSAPGSRA